MHASVLLVLLLLLVLPLLVPRGVTQCRAGLAS